MPHTTRRNYKQRLAEVSDRPINPVINDIRYATGVLNGAGALVNRNREADEFLYGKLKKMAEATSDLANALEGTRSLFGMEFNSEWADSDNTLASFNITVIVGRTTELIQAANDRLWEIYDEVSEGKRYLDVLADTSTLVRNGVRAQTRRHLQNFYIGASPTEEEFSGLMENTIMTKPFAPDEVEVRSWSAPKEIVHSPADDILECPPIENGEHPPEDLDELSGSEEDA